MKRVLTILAFSLFCILYTSATQAPYCLNSAFGYGAAATGAGNITPTMVNSESQLKNALKEKSSNKLIIITQSFSMERFSAKKLNNITILGLPGVTLTNLDQTQDNSGLLYFTNCNNIIIRNLTFIGPGAYDCDGWDLLCFDNVTNAWVDHCDFQDGCDGNFDNKGLTDNITVSWCRFRYLKAPRSGGSGGADDHRFSNLVGSGSSDAPSDGTYNMTWAYCWWDEGCKQRMVRARNASLHFLNCYWNSSVADYYIGPENMDAYVEGCYMAKLSKTSRVFNEDYGSNNVQNGLRFVNSYYAGGNVPDVNNRTVVVPTYAYTCLTYNEAKTAVTNNTCGAGATLTIDNIGTISTPCNNTDNTGEETEQPTITSNLTWNASDSDIKDLGTLTSNTTVRGLTFAATSDKNLVIDAAASPYTYTENDSTITFTNRIKLGGTGNANARHLRFDITGECDIDIYAMSANATSPRTLVLYTQAWGNNKQEYANLSGTDVNRLSYHYTGNATTVYLASSNSGINILGINVAYPTQEEATDIKQQHEQQADFPHCIHQNGMLIILHPDGRRFTILGQPL